MDSQGLNPGRGGLQDEKIDKVTVKDTKNLFHVWKVKSIVNMSGVKKDQGGVEEEREEEWGWGLGGDSGQWMIERKNDVIFYENVLASGKFYKFSKLDWIGLSACCLPINFFLKRLITCDVLNKFEINLLDVMKCTRRELWMSTISFPITGKSDIGR